MKMEDERISKRDKILRVYTAKERRAGKTFEGKLLESNGGNEEHME